MWNLVGKRLGRKSVRDKWMGLMVGIYVVGMVWMTWSWYAGMKMQMNDLGNVVQPLYNTLNGRLMEMSNGVSLEDKGNRWGGHANLIFLLLVPVYAGWSDPRSLMVVQTLVVASGAVGLCWLGEKVLGKKTWLVMVAPIAYLVSPVVQDVNLFDFHAMSLAMPLVIWMVYGFEARKWRWFWLVVGLLLATKEDMGLVVVAMGVVMILKGERKLGWRVLAVGVGYFGLVVGKIMPWFRGAREEVLMAKRYGELGGNVMEVALAWIKKPDVVWRKLVSGERLGYLGWLGITSGMVGVYDYAILWLAVPSLLINGLSENAMMSWPFGTYHSGVVVAALAVGVVYGLAKLKREKKPVERVGLGVVGLSMGVSLWLAPAPYSLVSSWEEFRVSDHAREVKEMVKLIGDGASVVVQNNLGGFVAGRREVITFPAGVGEGEYVVLDVSDPYVRVRIWPRQRNMVYIVGMGLSDYRDVVEEVFEREDYGVEWVDEGGYLMFKKGAGDGLNEEGRKMFEERMVELEERYGEFEVGYAGGGS